MNNYDLKMVRSLAKDTEILEPGESVIKSIKSTEDVKSILPKFMKLPIRGFTNTKYHCLVATNHLNDLIKHSSDFSKAVFAFSMGLGIDNTVSDIDDAINNNNFNLTDMGPLALRLAYHNKYVATMIMPRLHYILSTWFYGVQPVSGGIGITELKDNRVQYFGENDFHVVLSPYEFIIFNQPVHAAASGVVTEITNEYEDKTRSSSRTINFATYKPDEYIGNKIVITYNNFVRLVYGNIKKNSFCKKVGDTVEAGEVIAHVGQSGWFPTPYLFFSMQLVGVQAPVIGNMRVTIPSIMQLWDTHYESPLVDIAHEHGKAITWELMRKLDSHKIKYSMKGSQLSSLCFAKQLPTIFVE